MTTFSQPNETHSQELWVSTLPLLILLDFCAMGDIALLLGCIPKLPSISYQLWWTGDDLNLRDSFSIPDSEFLHR